MNKENETLLLAKGASASNESITKLSKAIVKSQEDSGFCNVQAIGPSAVNNIVKSYIKSKSLILNDDNAIELVCQFAYQKPHIGDKTVTAIMSRIFPIAPQLIVSPQKDTILLMTKGANSSPENILKLAQAIVKSLSENNCAELQSIGAVAVNNAIKAYIKAKGMISEYVNGVELVCQFSYQKPVIDGKQITAIKMNIFAIPSKFVI